MSSEIDVWMTTPTGTRVLPLAHYDRLQYTRAVNDVGDLEITLPGHFDTQLVRPDSLIMVYRDGRLETETAWLVRAIQQRTDRLGVRSVTLAAVSGLDLLRRRVTGPLAAEDADRTGLADDLIKAFARENIGTSAGNRALSSTLFQVASDTGQGASVTIEAGYQPLLATCQDLAKASAEAGTPLWFDLVWIEDEKLWELRTYTGQRGTDKSRDSGAPQTLSIERGTIGLDDLTDDYADEVTVVYVGGQGDDANRLVETVEDTSRSGRSVYGRIETFQSSNSADTDTLENEGRQLLQRSRPRRTYVAEVISNANTQYGRDYLFGDIVTAHAYGMEMDCRIDAVHVTIDNLDGGRETVRVRLTNVADL